MAKGTVLTGEHLVVIDKHCLHIAVSDIELPVLEYSRVPEEEKRSCRTDELLPLY
jgi:hypothetical protein